MNSHQNITCRQSGFSMIEVLVTLIILLLGLLGLVGVMAQSQRSEMESYQRVQAVTLLQDMVGRINANRKAATCYAYTTNTTSGTPYLGTGSTYTPACNSAAILAIYPLIPSATATLEAATAVSDMSAWNNTLLGAAETFGGGNVGAMVGARGCVSYGGVGTELINPVTGLPIAGTGIYTVAVAWQGLGSTAIATPNCAQGLYGTNDAQRRVVSLTLRTASLL